MSGTLDTLGSNWRGGASARVKAAVHYDADLAGFTARPGPQKLTVYS
jgi:hypothetical protein